MIDWREDGSIAFEAGGVEIVWEAPTVNALANAYNGHIETADAVRAIADTNEEEDDVDDAADRLKVNALVETWVRAVHEDVGDGDLPDDVGDWPHWLVNPLLPGKVRVHWSTHPFDWKTSLTDLTETAP